MLFWGGSGCSMQAHALWPVGRPVFFSVDLGGLVRTQGYAPMPQVTVLRKQHGDWEFPEPRGTALPFL